MCVYSFPTHYIHIYVCVYSYIYIFLYIYILFPPIIYICVCVCVCVCDWVTLLYSIKLTEHCKPTIIEKIKIIK